MSTLAQSSLIPPAKVSVSVVMPCLNEQHTVGQCVRKAAECLRALGVAGEVVVADNGSTDDSALIAAHEGARVVRAPRRGYGAALQAGCEASRGRYIIMGDADMSYDFSDLGQFIAALRGGHDLVIGSRFRGSIKPKAMPWHHRYIGNPVLSFLVRRMFRTGITDCHSGMRGFTRSAYDRMELRSSGMEFASEMVINSVSAGLRITEVPITLYPDGRPGKPHLQSFRDGWRHLRLMLLMSPFFLFLLPAALLLTLGLFLLVAPLVADIVLFGHRLQEHFSLLGNLLVVIGIQIAWLGVFAKTVSHQLGPRRDPGFARLFLNRFTLERLILGGLALFLAGTGVGIWILADWVRSGFAEISRLGLAIVSSTVMMIGLQGIFSGFFLSLIRLQKHGKVEVDGHE